MKCQNFTENTADMLLVRILYIQTCSVDILRSKKNRKGIEGLYKKEKRQDWDHKVYHDAPSAI